MSTPAQIEANQANAQLSTGPVTPEGKAAVSKNALKTGLTGRTVLLPTEDAERYEKHIADCRDHYKPVGTMETELTQSIADTMWRIGRVPSLEAALFAVGRTKLANLHTNETDPSRRGALLDAEILLAYERQFRNLQTQEARLRRSLENDIKQLEILQQRRKTERSAQLTKAAQALAEATRNSTFSSYDRTQFGFEFSFAEIDDRLAKIDPDMHRLYRAKYARRAA